jgi:hypothetical protein
VLHTGGLRLGPKLPDGHISCGIEANCEYRQKAPLYSNERPRGTELTQERRDERAVTDCREIVTATEGLSGAAVHHTEAPSSKRATPKSNSVRQRVPPGRERVARAARGFEPEKC